VDAPEPKTFVIERRDSRLYLRGALLLRSGTDIWREIHRAAAGTKDALDIDLSDVEVADGASVALLVDLRARLSARGVKSEFIGGSKRITSLVGVYGGYSAPPHPARRARHGFIEHLGHAVRSLSSAFRRMVEFVGDTVVGGGGAIARPITGNWRSVLPLVVRAGTDAIPLVLLLNFLLGFVMGYESCRQLERYGAQLFIADVVGVAVTRELSPVMTSIIVLGRSAAAYAAELGTMKVSEELDALRTMGLAPIRHLVVPRMLALSIVTPLLTLIGDIFGVIGGAIVGATRLDVTPHAYLAELREVIILGDIGGGLLKAAVAGLTIAVIGCQQGFATSGGPAGVGSRTTSTVVKSLVALVFIDAFFAVFLGALRR
jgi:phospholipid/cholesterol/gamma-HCH transport system permease protein